jgi:hypothetical protein
LVEKKGEKENKIEVLSRFILSIPRKEKRASYSYRTATTAYLCLVSHLEGSAGADRIRLAFAAKINLFFHIRKFNIYDLLII